MATVADRDCRPGRCRGRHVDRGRRLRATFAVSFTAVGAPVASTVKVTVAAALVAVPSLACR